MSVKTANVGHFMIPTAPAAGTAVAQSASANTYGTKTNIGGTSLGALYITGVYVEVIAGTNLPTYVGVQLYVTASTVIDTMNVPLGPTSGVASTQWGTYKPIFPPVPVAATTQILAATASSVASAISYLVTLECILQSNVVDDGIAVGTVTLVTTTTTVTNQLTAAAIATGVWTDTTAGDFTTALSVGKSVMNGVALGTGLTINAYTGNTVQTGDAFAIVKSGGTGDNAAIKTKTDFLPSATAGAAGGVFIAGTNAATTVTTSFTTTFTGSLTGSVASVTGAVGSVTGAVGSVTGLTASNLDAAVSTRMATYTQPTGFLAATFPGGTIANTTNVTAGTITTTTSLTNAPTVGDFTTAMKTSIGTAVAASAVASVTGNVGGSVASVTGSVGGNVTGSVGSVVGAVGSVTGLTASNLDATVSSRSTYAGGAVASVTGAVGSVAAPVTVTGTPDVNIVKVRGATITGDGSAGTPWGP